MSSFDGFNQFWQLRKTLITTEPRRFLGKDFSKKCFDLIPWKIPVIKSCCHDDLHLILVACLAIIMFFVMLNSFTFYTSVNCSPPPFISQTTIDVITTHLKLTRSSPWLCIHFSNATILGVLGRAPAFQNSFLVQTETFRKAVPICNKLGYSDTFFRVGMLQSKLSAYFTSQNLPEISRIPTWDQVMWNELSRIFRLSASFRISLSTCCEHRILMRSADWKKHLAISTSEKKRYLHNYKQMQGLCSPLMLRILGLLKTLLMKS